jgi:parallel beta-helix repeat protein
MSKGEKNMKKKIFVFSVCFLVIITALPVSSTTVSEPTPQSQIRGNILYVGGLGPNNYTKIQDAINDAKDGDTVFVYDDSSPYFENVIINVSISLIGEDKHTTIIDGANSSNVVNLKADDVTITGFTILHGNNSGISISSNNNNIVDNILSDNLYGIMTNYGNLSIPSPPNTGHNMITQNRIIHNGFGVFFVNEWNSTFSRNIFSGSEIGIVELAAVNNNISFNMISENEISVFIVDAYNTMVYRNNISLNEGGVVTVITSADKILQNNFIGNNKSALTGQPLLSKIRMVKMKLQQPLRRNVWNGNYWDGPRSLPYIVPGLFKLRFSVDWHPAQKPYDIPVGR